MKVDIKRLAKLSKLSVDESQEAKFEQQMQDIIGMVDNLPPLEGKGALLDKKNPMVMRADESENLYKRDDILSNAPQVQSGCVVVPKIID